MDKNDIIDYVMHTPHNTNRAVLSSMLNQLAEGGDDSGGSWTVLTEESVTTALIPKAGTVGGRLSYSQQINADTIRVTFNGTEYECEKRAISTPSGNNYTYGTENSWDDYPFTIHSNAGIGGTIINVIDTESAGTYTIKIESPQSGGSSDFSTAMITFAGSPIGTITGAFDTADTTWGIITLGLPSDSGRSESVILKNGQAVIVVDTKCTITVAGAIEADDEQYIVSGDCTITYASPK